MPKRGDVRRIYRLKHIPFFFFYYFQFLLFAFIVVLRMIERGGILSQRGHYMKRSLVLFVSILFVLLSLVVFCASSKVEKTENVEKVEEIVTIEEPEKEDSPKAELIDGFLYVNGHRIDIYLDGGTLEGDIESILSTANETGFITIPKVKKDGYLFLSWLDLDKGSIEEITSISI